MTTAPFQGHYNNAFAPDMYPAETVAAPTVKPAPPARRSSGFTAQYRGVCGSCDGTIHPGSQAAYGIDNVLEHVTCPEPLTLAKQGACPTCWLELPVTGVCGTC